jgi:hypothetical protein
MKYRRRHHEIPADQGERASVVGLHACCLAGAAPPVDYPQLSARLGRVGVASVGLIIGSFLVVEIAQNRRRISA